jgi:hypothetical protein
MRDKADLSRTNEVRAQRNKGIPQTSVSEPKDANVMRMDSEGPAQLPHLNVDVVGDVVEQMMPLASHELFISMGNGNGITLMGIVISTSDVDRRPSTTVRVSILESHGRRDVGLWVDSKVRHCSRIRSCDDV